MRFSLSLNGTVILLFLTFARYTDIAHRVLNLKPLIALGLISFSTYLWLQLFTTEEGSPELRTAPIAVGATVLVGATSFIEAPFLRMKGRFAR